MFLKALIPYPTPHKNIASYQRIGARAVAKTRDEDVVTKLPQQHQQFEDC